MIVTSKTIALILYTVALSLIQCTDGFHIPSRGATWNELLSRRRRVNAPTMWRADPLVLSNHQAGLTMDAGTAGVPVERGGSSRAPGRLRALWRRYEGALASRPLLVKSLTSGVISGAGFILAQVANNPAVVSINPSHLAVYVLVGTLYIPVALHFWFGFLESIVNSKLVSSRLKGNKWGRALLQLAVDQTLGAALVNSGFFVVHTVFSTVAAGQPTSVSALAEASKIKVTREFWTMMRLNWRIWPLANFFNFALVPVELRVLVTNLVAILWNVFMSRMCAST